MHDPIPPLHVTQSPRTYLCLLFYLFFFSVRQSQPLPCSPSEASGSNSNPIRPPDLPGTHSSTHFCSKGPRRARCKDRERPVHAHAQCAVCAARCCWGIRRGSTKCVATQRGACRKRRQSSDTTRRVLCPPVPRQVVVPLKLNWPLLSGRREPRACGRPSSSCPTRE